MKKCCKGCLWCRYNSKSTDKVKIFKCSINKKTFNYPRIKGMFCKSFSPSKASKILDSTYRKN